MGDARPNNVPAASGDPPAGSGPGSTAEDARRLLTNATRGDADARDRLVTLAYDRLREIASRLMRDAGGGHTLQPTALVNEAFLKLFGAEAVDQASQAHFLAIAAAAMRQVLIDHARGRNAIKRGGRQRRVAFNDTLAVAGTAGAIDAEALGRALDALREHDERACQVVELRFFGGLTSAQTAEVLGVARSTVAEDWAHARAWLRIRLEDEMGP